MRLCTVSRFPPICWPKYQYLYRDSLAKRQLLIQRFVAKEAAQVARGHIVLIFAVQTEREVNLMRFSGKEVIIECIKIFIWTSSYWIQRSCKNAVAIIHIIIIAAYTTRVSLVRFSCKEANIELEAILEFRDLLAKMHLINRNLCFAL